jgi:hypothetical protein
MADPTTASGLVGNTAAAPATASITGNQPAGTYIGTSSSVAGNAEIVGGVNVANEAADIMKDPLGYLGSDAVMKDQVPTIDANAAGTTINQNDYQMDVDALQGSAATASVAQASQVTKPITTPTMTTSKTGAATDMLIKGTNTPTATVTQDNLVDVDTFDMKGLATGVNSDGTQNEVGQQLQEVHTQNTSNIIDTSTVAGKLLAQSLGEGNYLDMKSTVQGQLTLLQKDFTDPVTGQPTIPAWAAGAVRGVNRMIAFKGISGTSAMSVMTQAIMEATLPIAQADATIFSNFDIKNMDAKNANALQTAQILANLKTVDLDARMTGAVKNAETFTNYDMINLDAEQKMVQLKFQAKQQSIFEDAKQENVTRALNINNKLDTDKFYDQLSTTTDQFNVSQRNAMEQFNSGELNSMEKFNLEMQNVREQFEMNNQFRIDQANATWRQNVTLQNAQMEFEAAAMDVKTIVSMTSEQMNRMWNRTDQLLDYAWKEGENEKDRKVEVYKAKLAYDAQKKDSGGLGGILGTVAGAALGSFTGGLGTEMGTQLGASLFKK